MSKKVVAQAIILDPSCFFRDGAAEWLRRGGLAVLISVPNPEEAFQRLNGQTPNLALLGPNFPDCECIAVCREMIRHWPDLKIILFAVQANNLLFQADAARAGVNACLPPEVDAEETLAAIAGIMTGHQLFSRDVLSQAFQPIALTPREREVLKCLVEGKTDREIAGELVLSLPTVRKHSQQVLKKLGVHQRREAVRRARRLGMV